MKGIITDPSHSFPLCSSTSLINLILFPSQSSKTSKTCPSSLSLIAVAWASTTMSLCSCLKVSGSFNNVFPTHELEVIQFAWGPFLACKATQNSPFEFLLTLSGYPGTSAKTSDFPALGPLSQYLMILPVVVSATSTKERSLLIATPLAKASPRSKTVTSLLDLSYFINLPVLSPLKSAAMNCLQMMKRKPRNHFLSSNPPWLDEK